ncbi:helix-turn-helix domain-containing protein [Nocardia sp. NPDC058519]|uniref:helix-turn-helix domain-containing protein n=1 Tax=Nocardia sp. NPDC058519 TaxID=3346535 RepID=UPI0036492CC8
MHEGDTVGANIKRIRNQRGMTQGQLAAAAHVGRATLSTVENGHAAASTVWIGAIAGALGVDAGVLYGQDEPEQLLDVLPVLRRALAATDLMDPDLEPQPIEKLQALSAQVARWRKDTAYRKVVGALPDLVDQLLIAGNHGGEPAFALLCDAYRAANTVAHKLGYSDLSLTATERMEWAATRSGDPLLLATTHYVKAATLSRVGAPQQALRLLNRAMSDIEPIVDEDATAAAVYSILHMRAGTIAAAMGDADTSRSHLAEASQLARHFGPERIVYDTPVGATNIALYRVCAEVDLGEPGRALEVAKGTRFPDRFPKERMGYFWLDTARAHLLAGDVDEAIGALYESRLAAPEHFRSSSSAKNIIKTAAAQQRRASESLRSLANYAGVRD